ncbi:MAG: hypothetical protein PHU85_00305 [Phycisphaerae bacterium]|nr:hypothetical protein [Phycisphaerae bacterium]
MIIEVREALAEGALEQPTLAPAGVTIPAGGTVTCTWTSPRRRFLCQCLNSQRLQDAGLVVDELQVTFNRVPTASQDYDTEALPGSPVVSNTRRITTAVLHNPGLVTAVLSGAGKNVTVAASAD